MDKSVQTEQEASRNVEPYFGDLTHLEKLLLRHEFHSFYKQDSIPVPLNPWELAEKFIRNLARAEVTGGERFSEYYTSKKSKVQMKFLISTLSYINWL